MGLLEKKSIGARMLSTDSKGRKMYHILATVQSFISKTQENTINVVKKLFL